MFFLPARRSCGPAPARRRAPLLVEVLEDRLPLAIQQVVDTTTLPFSAVVQLEADNDGRRTFFSGVLIGRDRVLTVAHGLYDADGGLAESVRVYPGRNGHNVFPFGVARGVSWSVHSSYVTGRWAGAADYDLAVVTLDRPVGDVAGTLPLSAAYPDAYFDNRGDIYILGYPGQTRSGVHQYLSVGPAQGANVNVINWARRDAPIESGSSGSPVYVRVSATERHVVGLVSQLSSAHGFATRLTGTKLAWIEGQIAAATVAPPPPTAPAADTPGAFDPATGTWYLRNSFSAGAPDVAPFRYGGPGWAPVVGDWDGDGISTVGTVDPTTATWYVKNFNATGGPDYAPFRYGAPGWVYLAGDWDGNGTMTPAAFDPVTATWYLRNSCTAGPPDVTPFRYGGPGWAPVVGDWDGDGRWSVGVIDPATMTWYLTNTNTGGPPSYTPFAYGAPGCLPVVGDWDGDGDATPGVVAPDGTWHLRNVIAAGAADYPPFAYGGGGLLPVAGDWAGAIAATFTRPAARWFDAATLLRSQGEDEAEAWLFAASSASGERGASAP